MSLSVYTGPMCSGKTSANMSEMTTHVDTIDGISALYINHIFDTRDAKNLVSSNSSSYNGISKKIDVIQVTTLAEVESKVDFSKYSIVGIDEAQLFPDLEEYVRKWLIDYTKHLFVSGLDTDFEGNDFGYIKDILKYSSKFVKLQSRCKKCIIELTKTHGEGCHFSNIPYASFTGRIGGSEAQVQVGGLDMYVPLCLMHHQEHLKNSRMN